MSISRRTFLRGAGGLAVGLPLMHWPGRARGQSQSFPKRFIVMTTANGVIPTSWFPIAGNSEEDFALNVCHEPLERHKRDLILTSGINMMASNGGPGEPHQRGMGTLLTGQMLQQGTFVGGDGSLAGWADGQSIDQRMVDVIGTDTAHPSLHLGVRCIGAEVRQRISYRAAAQPVPVQNDPRGLFAQLFTDFDREPTEQQRLRDQRGSVLDAVMSQFAEVNQRIGAADRQKLEQHLTMVRDVEQRLSSEPLPGDHCYKPGIPPLLDVNSEQTMEALIQLQMDLLVMALACDLTRVVTLQISEAVNHIRYPWINSMGDGHALSHAGPSNQDATDQWVARDRWHAEQFAYLLDRMRAIPEDGSTMLDNSVILWGNELARGNTHSHNNMPFLLAGSAAGYLRTGRYLQFQSVSHCNLLVTLLNAMGLPDQTWGRDGFCDGPLTELR